MSTLVKIGPHQYDITDLLNIHPGGRDILLKYNNRNATSIFNSQHGNNSLVWDKLQKYKTNMEPSNDVYISPYFTCHLTCKLCPLVEKISLYLARGEFRDLIASNKSLFREELEECRNYDQKERFNHLHADMSFICTAYLREDEVPVDLPEYLVSLWKLASDAMEREPMLDYVDCVLSNWKDNDKEGGEKCILRSFTGLKDEIAFYRIHLLAEFEVERFVKQCLILMQADDNIDIETVKVSLEKMIKSMEIFRSLAIDEMYKQVDPYIFYNRLRNFLGKYENVNYEGLGNRSYPGPTAAQSCMLEIVDTVLGLPEPTGPLKEILDRFKPHQDAAQKKIINTLSQGSSIKYIVENCLTYCQDDELYLKMVRLYNHLVSQIISFRDSHIKLVNDYIFKFNPEAAGTGGTYINEMLAPRKELTLKMYMRVPGKIDNPEEEENLAQTSDPTVTPWEVSGAIDYNKLIDKFGCLRIDENILSLFKQALKVPLHRFIRRGIFFSHRDLNLLLEDYLKGKPFYLYTGRGPSSETMHLGHLVPFQFTAWLQKVFKVPLVIQMTDDEKYLFRDINREELKHILYENVKDIIACGFDPELTFIFSDFEYVGTMYPVIVEIWKRVTHSQLRGIFGFEDTNNAGCWAFPAIQAAPSFPQAFPHIFGDKIDINCLIPQAIDQDPYFRMTRDVAPKMKCNKPALIHSTFFPSIKGPKSKMSSSDPHSTISLADSAKDIQTKITKYAFSGGRATRQEHEKYGGNTDIDVSYQLLKYFLEDDDELAQIKTDYESGKMLTGQIKKLAINCIQNVVKEHADKRSKITDEDVLRFMSRRPLVSSE